MTTFANQPATELSASEFDRLVRTVVDRVSKRVATEIESRRTTANHTDTATTDASGLSLEFDRVEQELLAGGWIADELARLDEVRLRSGSPVLTRPALAG